MMDYLPPLQEQVSALAEQCAYLCEQRHQSMEVLASFVPLDGGLVSKWRMKDRMKTGCVALVMCLNIGVDPPDVIKVSPCARVECWIDPSSMSSQKALEAIGRSLQAQYERWQPRVRAGYKLQLDPTIDELKKLCSQCRKGAKSERVLFHYNGHGVPKPTANGELWFFNKNYTQYIPLSVYELNSWVGMPSIYVFDCSRAGLVMNAFLEMPAKECILLSACGATETLPQSSRFPADIFTACLTTPIKMALIWFSSRSLIGNAIDPELIDKIPGRQDDRKTLLGELNWIFTAITDTIAWNVLPRELFQRLFRQDLLVASLFRNFLLAERIMRSANCSPECYPCLPMTHQHSMWHAWDMAVELCISQLPSLVDDPNSVFQPSPFFTQQLTAFELWLDHGSEKSKPPEQLPIVLQVLLSQSHRHRALLLLGKFLDMGAWAINLALSVGIFPYVLKLLQPHVTELRQILVFIWAKILALDKSCQVDLVKDRGHEYFIKFLDSPDIFPEQAAMAAFVLAVINDGYSRGQTACLESNLAEVCLRIIQSGPCGEPLLLQWLCLCLSRLWDGQPEAQLRALTASAPVVLEQLLVEPQPEVRAAAASALGALISVKADNDDIDDDDEEDTLRMEQELMKPLLKVINDGSPLVRSESAIALARLTVKHNICLRAAAAAYLKPPSSISLAGLGSTRSSSSFTGSSGSSQLFFAGRLGCFTEHNNDPAFEKALAVRNQSVVNARATASAPASPSEDAKLARSDYNVGSMRPKKLHGEDGGIYVHCVAAAYTLVRDPCPWVASLGHDALRRIGVESFIMQAGKAIAPQNGTLKRSASWIDSGLGLPFRSSASPPRPVYLTPNPVLLRRVPSVEFCSQQNVQPAAKDANSCIVEDLPESILYRWSCSRFAQPLLDSDNDKEEEALALRDEREKAALDGISKCQRSNVSKITDQIASLDIQPEGGSKAAVLHPFRPLVCTADGKKTISVWDYEAGSLVNAFSNYEQGEEVVSRLCLINELSSDGLLLVATSEGNIRVWKNFLDIDGQQLATAWQAIQGRRPGTRGLNAVVDWQQPTGYLYASGEVSAIMVWDLDRELLATRIPTRADTCVSAISASQVHDPMLMAGCGDGSTMLFDIRKQDMLVASSKAHMQRTVGVDFCQSGTELRKVISASISGDVKMFDLRNLATPIYTLEAHKGHMTSLAVHRHAPVFATGSGKQSIRVFSCYDGEALSMIRYHNSFLGQRIGPVSCMSFHPYRLRLAAGATDSLVSVYAAPGDSQWGGDS